ncbi:MAG: hypothetical protein WCT32_03850 [Patescibacteria group bacterium]|jgi:uncharacterized repeat protein (TIGR01451 family)
MRFNEYLKTKIKSITGLSLLVSLLSFIVFPAVSAQALEPRFNFLDGDYELLFGRNATQNQRTWDDPISGSAGDEFEGVIYYHNGSATEDASAPAENVVIKLNIPDRTDNLVANLTASIAASNASTVATETSVDGRVIGTPGLTIQLDKNAQVEPVAGSVKWYKEVQRRDDILPGSGLVPVTLNDDLFSANGANIGTVNACWPFAGFITFRVRTTAITNAVNFSVDKKVRNISRGENDFLDQTSATSNQELAFNIDVTNTGTASIDNLIVKDIKPSELTFVPGTLEHVVSGASMSLPDSDFDKLVGDGLPMSHPVGQDETHAFRFKVKSPSVITAQSIVKNKAIATAGSISKEDEVSITLRPDEGNVVKRKGATNTTSGKQAAKRSGSALELDANPGDIIVYSLTATSEGGRKPGFVVEDGIADILEYAEVTNISDSGVITDGTTGNDAKLIRWPAVDLTENQPLNFTFTVRVKNPIPNQPQNGTSFDFVMYNKYGDEVMVRLPRPAVEVKKADLKIEKLVRNFTANESNFVDNNEAFSTDTLEYKIEFSNKGNAPADVVRFLDTLPANTQYVPGTTIISLNGSMEKTLPEGLINTGIVLDTIAPGDSGYIKIRVVLSGNIAAGETLTNTASLKDDDTILTDTAKTKIKTTIVTASSVTTTVTETETPIIPNLPKSGAAASASFMLTLVAGVAITYVRYRKVILDQLEVAEIASDIFRV